MNPSSSDPHSQASKFLSYVLRHRPDEIGLTLDPEGWVGVDDLITAAQAHGKTLDAKLLHEIVATNSKKRFEFSSDAARIRASQGHSVTVDLGYTAQIPPDLLYHGTVDRFLDSIRVQGLIKGDRHHVHLSADVQTAQVVGSRRGKPVLLVVQAKEMHEAGHAFYLSTNGVWLTEHVPAAFLLFQAFKNTLSPNP